MPNEQNNEVISSRGRHWRIGIIEKKISTKKKCISFFVSEYCENDPQLGEAYEVIHFN